MQFPVKAKAASCTGKNLNVLKYWMVSIMTKFCIPIFDTHSLRMTSGKQSFLFGSILALFLYFFLQALSSY